MTTEGSNLDEQLRAADDAVARIEFFTERLMRPEVLSDLREFIASLENLPTAFRDPGSRTGVPSAFGGGAGGAPAGTPADPLTVTFGPQANFPTGLAAELALRDAPRNVVPGVFDSRIIPIPGVTSTQPTQAEIQAARAAQNELTRDAALAAASLRVFTSELDGLRQTRLIPTPNAFATVAGAVPIPIPDVTATGQTRSQLQAVASESNAVELAAIKAEAALRSYTQSLEDLGRIVAIPRPGVSVALNAGNAPGGVFVPPQTPEVIQGFIDAGATVRLELERGAQATALASQEASQNLILGGLRAGAGIASAIRSGSPSGIFGAVTGGIGGLIGGFGGQVFGLVGSIISGFLPGQATERQEAARAAGANVRGAPAINLNFTFNQSLALASLTDPESRQALASQANDAFQRIERIIQNVVLPRLERLEGGAA